MCVCMFLLVLFLLHLFWTFKKSRPKLENLKGKCVLVTGCDTGLGRLAVKAYRDAGFKVLANFLMDSQVPSVKKELGIAEGDENFVPVVFDITDKKAVADAVETVSKLAGGELWALVNNARIFEGYWVEFSELSEYRRVMDINFIATVNVTQAFLPLIKKAQGRIINVGSGAGRLTVPGLTAYSASRYALEAFSDALRNEIFGFGVKVSLVEPGIMETDLRISASVAIQKAASASHDALMADYRGRWGSGFGKDDRTDVIFKAGDPKGVINAMLHATTAQFPSARYPVGKRNHYLVLPLSYLPSFISDWFIRRRTKKLLA